MTVRTLYQAGAALGKVFDEDVSSAIFEEAVEGTRLFVLGDGVSNLRDAPIALT